MVEGEGERESSAVERWQRITGNAANADELSVVCGGDRRG